MYDFFKLFLLSNTNKLIKTKDLLEKLNLYYIKLIISYII